MVAEAQKGNGSYETNGERALRLITSKTLVQHGLFSLTLEPKVRRAFSRHNSANWIPSLNLRLKTHA